MCQLILPWLQLLELTSSWDGVNSKKYLVGTDIFSETTGLYTVTGGHLWIEVTHKTREVTAAG